MLDELTPSLIKNKVALERYDHVELTEEEIEEALRLAREAKDAVIKREEYRKRVAAINMPKVYNAEEVFAEYEKIMEVDDDNRNIVKNLCCYFTGDKRFKGDLNKGILLYGSVGIGKSALMRFFMLNQIATYRVVSCRDIESDYSKLGEDTVKRYSYLQTVAINSNTFGHREIGVCFDDLGTEVNGKHYGKEKNVMSEIILNRYDNQLENKYTHVTTNLDSEQLKSEYGERVLDRMRQMFNIIAFPDSAKSRRK